jgi:DNA adenine methylase
MTDDMHIKALAPWFGGKRTLAADVVAELGRHTQYFEPFCGGMSMLLAKQPSQKETVNDLHGDLVNLARVIQDEPLARQLYAKLDRVLFTQDLLEQSREHLDDGSPISLIVANWESVPAAVRVDRAFHYFAASWMGRNGTAGTARLDYQIAVRWTKGGGSPTVRWRNAVDCIPLWHRRLQNVVILRRDAFQILDRFEDCAGTAIYADPPYLADTRSRGSIPNGRGGKYLHEFNHDSNPLMGLENDHERLARILRGYRHARVVVSYYDSPAVRAMYPGWTVISKTMNKQLHAQNGRGSRQKEAPEILLVNGPSLAQGVTDAV